MVFIVGRAQRTPDRRAPERAITGASAGYCWCGASTRDQDTRGVRGLPSGSVPSSHCRRTIRPHALVEADQAVCPVRSAARGRHRPAAGDHRPARRQGPRPGHAATRRRAATGWTTRSPIPATSSHPAARWTGSPAAEARPCTCPTSWCRCIRHCCPTRPRACCRTRSGPRCCGPSTATGTASRSTCGCGARWSGRSPSSTTTPCATGWRPARRTRRTPCCRSSAGCGGNWRSAAARWSCNCPNSRSVADSDGRLAARAAVPGWTWRRGTPRCPCSPGWPRPS